MGLFDKKFVIYISPNALSPMYEFENTIDRKRFESTNSLWNELMLNDPWSVGYVVSLIESRSFARKEDWEEFYYESGEIRNQKIAELDAALCHKLNDEMLVLKNRSEVRQMSKELLHFNYYFGRTHEQLTEKAVILFQEAVNRSIDITIQECIEAVRFRTICQTWNGVVIRERNTIKTLREIFPDCRFVSVKGEYDHRFAVDYELFRGDNLTCGIQIKPETYQGKSSYLFTARKANEKKNLHYSKKFGKPVLTLISKSSGEVVNAEILSQISALVTE